MEAVNEKSIIEAGELVSKAREEMGKRIVGQSDLIDGLLMGLIAGGHVLVEGVPGLAKTLAETVSAVCGLKATTIRSSAGVAFVDTSLAVAQDESLRGEK